MTNPAAPADLSKPVRTEKGIREFVVLFIALGVLLTVLYGQRGLNEPDEGRYANIAINFVDHPGNLWEPRMSGFGHYDKPPLVYWATALAFEWLGRNEYAARLPSLFGAFCALLGLSWAAWRLYGREVAWWSILICGTLAQFWLLARFLTPDMFLTGWCTLAIAAWVECRHRSGHWGFWFLSLVFWSFAWWTKATPALVPLLGLVAGVWILRDDAGKKALRIWLMLPAIFALGLPWYLVMVHRYPELLNFFVWQQMLGHMIGQKARHGPIYYYVLFSPFAWLPWLPVLAVLAWVKRNQVFPRTRARWLKAPSVDGWIVITGLVVLTINRSKLPTYNLPYAPWVSLVLARVLLRLRPLLQPRSFRRLVFLALGSFVGLIVLVLAFYPRLEPRLGVNSSLRPIVRFLRQQGAEMIYLDHYWAGMDFYFGANVRYIVPNSARQRSDDDGISPELGETHFCPPEKWRETLQRDSKKKVWLVRYTREAHSPFDGLNEPAQRQQWVRIGHFLVQPAN
jgi:4-amino-4-deoxy-L-arabinose transferase-like glycosyltransferase